MANHSAAPPVTQAEKWAVTATLPPEVTARLLADVDVIARRMTRRIAAELVLPSQFRSVGYLRLVTSACRDALRTLVRLLRDGRGLRTADLQRLGSMGSQQAEMGVPLEVLLAAYRLAARVVWRELIGESAVVESLPQATVIAVTGQVLEYLDEISGAVGSAYLETRERLMRRRDLDRDRILVRLVAGDASPELRRLAAAADLDLQPPYLVLAFAVASAAAEGVVERRLRGRGVLLVVDRPGTWIALVPGRDSVPRVLDEAERSLPEANSVRWGIGPVAVTLEEIADSARRAREALSVGRRLDPTVRAWDDGAVGIFATLATDPEAMNRYVARMLGSVLALPLVRSTALLDTLEALLATASLNDAAVALGLHRHTVVYRSRRLGDLGIDLDAPAARHRLWLALQCRRLLAIAPALAAPTGGGIAR
ncbi:MAG: helix-turn-helix domain-containing protein [Candidatus Dormibacteraeota bacterium]|uniref:Helix-turn-helix domain-containing protein n=1 Tax=Candidatus Amunia macphersoniae TaxID=3127014 RepID=A0A934NJL1_9BACT|nr:helix-turn-helix domain-containing protein [Candidatus Dormibacteraeota bacterium]